jgi:hypothetical protein
MPDPEKRDVDDLIWLIESQLADAAVALELYLTAQQPSAPMTREKFLSAEAELAAAVEGVAADASGIAELILQIQHHSNSRKWDEGEGPNDYVRRLKFVHARSFVSSLDMVGKALAELQNKPSSGSLFTSLLA